MELAERPWVSIKEAKVLTPLTFDADGAHVTIKIALRNNGHSPAPVWTTPELFAMGSVDQELNRLCPSIRTNTLEDLKPQSVVVFPDTDTPQAFTVGIGKNDMIKSAKGGIVVVVPIVAVSYEPTFKSEALYCSAVAYMMWPTIFLSDLKPIPIDRLRLDRNAFFGEVAY